MKRLVSCLATGAVAGWVLLAGCSGGNPIGAGGGGASSSSSAAGAGGASAAVLAAYCDATAEPFCEALFHCCTDPGVLMLHGETVEGCEQLYRYGGERCYADPVMVKLQEEWIEDGSSVLDQATLDACVAHLKEMSAGGAACVEPPEAYLNMVCRGAFLGQRVPGEACARVPANFGYFSHPQCIDGKCASSKCVKLPDLGEPCVPWDGCVWRQQNVCVDATDSMTYDLTCNPLGDIGDPCNPAVWNCKSLNCDPATSKCALPDPATDACRSW